MKSKQRIFLFLGLLLVLAILVPVVTLLVWAYSLASVQPTPVAIPNPNGYEKLLEAAAVIEGDAEWDPDAIVESDIEELMVFVDQNGEAIELARAALQHKSVVPGLGMAIANELHEMRKIARTFAAAGRLAEFQGDDTAAIDFYVDCIRVGQSVQRGGILLHVLVGVEYENVGLNRLRELEHQLDTKQRIALCRTLHDLEIQRETAEELVARGKQLAIDTLGWMAILGMRSVLNFEQTAESTLQIVGRCDLQRRLLMAELAIEAYRNETGALPESLDVLVPDFLPEVLDNPFDGRPISYEKLEEGYRLFGLGPHRRATEMTVPLTLDNLD